jgi:hypothetical protein
MNSETAEKLLDVLAGLMAGQRDLLIKVTAAENLLLKSSSDQFREYEEEIVFVKGQVNMTPQMLALEKLRTALNQN